MISQYGMAIGNTGPVLLSFFNFAFFVVRDKVEAETHKGLKRVTRVQCS